IFSSIGAALLLTGGHATPARAAAPEVCVGTTGIQYVCVDPTGGTPITDCVYIVFPPCVPVSVPTPSVRCGGDLALLDCSI
ncbi:MAG: hypothetical protein M3217_07850, partial [Actinomycetota bacterium]|nr:hypothetical protein [Actinomycetota bacterium]